ncbi:MAG: hypothetical protein LBT00_06430 [Spirochaetaceae bacterium]|jgi:hypothetical protein|nr:hypothetical protein [Spirochaetaceae bacterium]
MKKKVSRGYSAKGADNGEMDKNETVDEIKGCLKKKLANPKEEVDRVEYTRENYLALFGDAEKAETVLGTVLISKNQFQKLADKERTGYLGAMAQTLNNPDIVIQAGPAKWYFVKSLKKSATDGIKVFMDVVVQKGNRKYSISLHQRLPNNILNKIKEPSDITYTAGRIKANGSYPTA